MASHIIIGDETIVIFDDGHVEYYHVMETHPHVIIRSELYPNFFLELIRANREWQIGGFASPHTVIVSTPFFLRDKNMCRDAYKSYKQDCTPVWNVRVLPGMPDLYYSSLISELMKCRDGRITHVANCGSSDPGHIGAIVKMDKLIKRAERQRELEHARRYEDMEVDIDKTLRFWAKKENGYLTPKLRNIPRPVLIEYLAENQACVNTWLDRLFGNVHESCSLSAERCRLPTNHLLYLLLKIIEDEPCLDLDDLLLARSPAVKAAYRDLGVPPLILK